MIQMALVKRGQSLQHVFYKHRRFLLSEILSFQDAFIHRAPSAKLLDNVHVEVILEDLKYFSHCLMLSRNTLHRRDEGV